MWMPGGDAPWSRPVNTSRRELTRVAPVTDPSRSSAGIASLTLTFASSNVGLVRVTTHSVVSPRSNVAGSQDLSNVTGACRRTIVSGSCARWPSCDSSSSVA